MAKIIALLAMGWLTICFSAENDGKWMVHHALDELTAKKHMVHHPPSELASKKHMVHHPSRELAQKNPNAQRRADELG